METNSFTCKVCGGTEIIIAEGRKLCRKCGAIIEEKIIQYAGREYRELGNVITTKMEYRIYRLKKRIHDISEELSIPPHIREMAIKTALRLMKHSNHNMKATTIALISLLYTTKLSGNIVLYERMKKYIVLKKGRGRGIGNKKHNLIRKMGWKTPKFSALTYLNLISNRIIDQLGSVNEKELVKEIVRNATKIYLDNRNVFIGKRPNTVAAVLLYLGEEITRRHRGTRKRLINLDILSNASGIGRNTIINRVSQYRRLLKL